MDQRRDQTKICTLVQFVSEGTDAGLYDCWPEVTSALPSGIHWERVSLEEDRRRHRIFNFDEFDTVVITNHAVNGDQIFSAQTGWLFFHLHGALRMDAWFRQNKNARLVVEHQGIRLVPIQAIYDSVLGKGEVSVSEFEPDYLKLSGSHCKVVQRFGNHPLLIEAGQDTGTDVHSDVRIFKVRESLCFGDPAPSWRGREGQLHETAINHSRNWLYGGWFESWGSDWVPLLQADNEYAPHENATLLIKVIDKRFQRRQMSRHGIIIATTMRLAAIENKRLLEALLTKPFDEIAVYHSLVRRRRRILDAVSIAASTLFFGVTAIAISGLWLDFLDLVNVTPNIYIKLAKESTSLPLVFLTIAWWRVNRAIQRRPYSTLPSAHLILRFLRDLVAGKSQERHNESMGEPR